MNVFIFMLSLAYHEFTSILSVEPTVCKAGVTIAFSFLNIC